MGMSSRGVTRRAIARAITTLPIAAAAAKAGRAATAGGLSEQDAKAASGSEVPEPNALKKAQDNVRQTGEKLRAIEVPMNVEPAFTFRA